MKVIPSIIEFWGMGLLQGILDCKGMEVKTCQNGEAGFGWFIRKIHPKETAAFFDEFWNSLGGISLRIGLPRFLHSERILFTP